MYQLGIACALLVCTATLLLLQRSKCAGAWEPARQVRREWRCQGMAGGKPACRPARQGSQCIFLLFCNFLIKQKSYKLISYFWVDAPGCFTNILSALMWKYLCNKTSLFAACSYSGIFSELYLALLRKKASFQHTTMTLPAAQKKILPRSAIILRAINDLFKAKWLWTEDKKTQTCAKNHIVPLA